MAKNAEKSAQVKSRQTKLSKKSSEELIEIILRKDKTERNLNAQVSNLKGEVNTLTSHVNSFHKDKELDINEIKRLRDTVTTHRERIGSLCIELKDIKEEYIKENKHSVELEEKVKAYKNAFYVAVGFGVLCLIGWILC